MSETESKEISEAKSKEITETKKCIDEKDIIRIKLTGKYATGPFQYAVISRNERNEELAKLKWYRSPKGYVANSTLGALHKVVKGFKKGDPQQVDHYDRNKLNMVDSNLIVATGSENTFNRDCPVGESGRTGVWKTPKNTWTARIQCQRKSIYLGTFATKEEAIKVREEAEMKYFGRILQNTRVYVDPESKPKPKFDGDIVYIPLSQTVDRTEKYTKIDRDKYDLVKQFIWSEDAGAAHNTSKGYLHQFLTNYVYDEVDHKNRDPLDNRMENLRGANHSTNGMNRDVQSNNLSGVPGVCFQQKSSLWLCNITINNRHICLGSWKQKEDAVKMRQFWEQKLFGEVAANKNIVVAPDDEIAKLMKAHPDTKAFKDCNFDPKQIRIAKE
jgi:hypothetical protein